MYLNKNIYNETVVIYDVLGNNIKSFTINGNKIDLTDLKNGIYFIQISNDRSCFKLILAKLFADKKSWDWHS